MAPKRAAKDANSEAKPPKVAKKENGDSAQKKKPGKTEDKKIDEDGGKLNPKQLVDRLLSKEMQALAYPTVPQGHGEVDWPAGTGKKPPPKSGAGKKADAKAETKDENDHAGEADEKEGKARTYTSPDLTPFEQLVCAALLSKPISHTLGLRAIRTILSPPFSLTSAKKMKEAGFEGRREAMWQARTQHKEKTATQLGDLVEGIYKLNGGEDEEKAAQLIAVRDQISKEADHSAAVEKCREMLSSAIKGIGPTGVDIFLRQVQRQAGWDKIFPFIDSRGLELASDIGLVHGEDAKDAERAAKAIAALVKNDKVKFVTVLDVLIGLSLEKKVDQAV